VLLQLQNESSYEILSHWHPNLTINLIDDHTHWVRGMVPSPLDECKYCAVNAGIADLLLLLICVICAYTSVLRCMHLT